ALSSLALPFGDHADTLVTWVTLLLFGACVWLVYRLGETVFGRWVGIVAAAAVLTRPALQRDAVLAYQDAGFAALVLAAVLAEAKRPRTGYRAAVLLALAGLLRPEAWLLSGVNLVWNWRVSDPRRRLTLLARAAAARRGGHADRRVRGRAGLRAAADRPLRAHAGRAAVPVLWAGGVRLHAGGRRRRPAAMADRRPRRAGLLAALSPLARRAAA